MAEQKSKQARGLFVILDGRQIGPLTPGAFREMAARGEITPETLVRPETGGNFVPADRVQGVTFGRPEEPPTARPAWKRRGVIAVAAAALLAALGAGAFYLLGDDGAEVAGEPATAPAVRRWLKSSLHYPDEMKVREWGVPFRISQEGRQTAAKGLLDLMTVEFRRVSETIDMGSTLPPEQIIRDFDPNNWPLLYVVGDYADEPGDMWIQPLRYGGRDYQDEWVEADRLFLIHGREVVAAVDRETLSSVGLKIVEDAAEKAEEQGVDVLR